MRHLIFPAVFLVAAGFVAADETAERRDTEYKEQVSVTASRTPIPIDETGNSITILTRSEIEAQGYPFVADLLRSLPGLSVSRSGPAGSQTQIRVRGSEANHVLVRIDGIDVSDVFGADELPFEMMTSHDIETIEFVRGPQSGLWGSDAVAGVINILTRSGSRSAGSAQIEAGSFGTLNAGGRIGLGPENLRFDAALSHLDTDGSNISRQGTERDGARNTTVTTGLRWTPERSPFSLEISARHTDSVSDFDDIDFFMTGLPLDAANRTDTDLTLGQATGRWASPGGRFSHQFGVSSAGAKAATTLSGAPDTSTRIDKLGASFQSTFDLSSEGSDQGHLVTIAVDHESRDFRQRGIASPFGDPNQDQQIDNTGIAVEYRFRAQGRWAATASVRHDNNSDFDDPTTFRVTGSLGFAGGKSRLRVAAGTGQKAPTFLERFGFFSGTFVGNPNLRPERSTSFEVGIDQQLGSRANLAVTYFRDRLEDEINGFFFDPAVSAITAVNESGVSDRQGVEVAFDTPVGKSFAIRGSYTFTDATEPDGAGGTDREIRRPRHRSSLSAHWKSPGDRFKIRGGLNYTGSQEDLFFPPFPQPSQRVELDSYLLANLHVVYAATRWLELFGRVDNLLDETYEDVYGFRAAGIGVYAGVRFRMDAK